MLGCFHIVALKFIYALKLFVLTPNTDIHFSSKSVEILKLLLWGQGPTNCFQYTGENIKFIWNVQDKGIFILRAYGKYGLPLWVKSWLIQKDTEDALLLRVQYSITIETHFVNL